ncbi:MAG: hypothetical protein V1858_00965 [Candidatus Gottesmanbacteria bacterium]
MDNKELLDHISFLEKNDGLRIPLMDRLDLGRKDYTQGWVVDGKLNPQWWNLFHTTVIPLKPREGRFSLLDRLGAKRKQELERLKRSYGEGFKCIVYEEEGWLLTYIRPSKLQPKDPNELLNEASKANQQRNHELFMTFCTEYQVATGCLDLR